MRNEGSIDHNKAQGCRQIVDDRCLHLPVVCLCAGKCVDIHGISQLQYRFWGYIYAFALPCPKDSVHGMTYTGQVCDVGNHYVVDV